MTARLISNAALWGMHISQGRAEEIAGWVAANGVDPDDVSTDHGLTVEDGPDGQVIRFRAYRRALDGAKYVDELAGGAAVEERAVPLVVEPPDGWPVYAVPDSLGGAAS